MKNLIFRYFKVYLFIVLWGGFFICGCQDQASKSGGMMMRNNPFKVTSDDILSVKTVGDMEAWLVGSFGNIFHTADGGKTWKAQDSKVGEQLCEVDFVDPMNGWIVGSNGTILHTEDGGKTWNPQISPVKKLFLSVDFFDKNHGWAVGQDGTLVRTTDGGKTWEDHEIKNGSVLNGVSFADKDTGWVVGDYGSILHTRDGGLTWEEQKCQDIIPEVKEDEWEQPLPMLFSVCFIDRNRGWAAGVDGTIIHTEDGGMLWKKLKSNSKGTIYSIDVNDRMGVAVGDKGTLIISNDGGINWAASIDGIRTRKWLRDQSLFGENECWVVGETGTLVKTVDGGKNWEMVSGRAYEIPISKKMISNDKG